MSNHNDIVIEMTSMLEQAETATTSEGCSIYRVPNNMRRLNEDSFTPKVVSIGPFHYGHPRLQNMEKYKLVYLGKFCQRISTSLDRLISFVEEIEPGVRLHYSEPIELSNQELVKVILLDSCFLFELFLRSYYREWVGVIMLKPWQATTVRMDLLLLENQLPFANLQKLFNRIFPPCMTNINGNLSFLRLTFEYFAYYNKVEFDPQDISISHFTDLIRTFHLPPTVRRPGRSPELVAHLQSATELADARVTLKQSKSPSCLLDFKFSGKILEIPELIVDDGTETLLRNLVALEQCHYPSRSYITDYFAIMDFLINTSNDVDLLVQKGVIVNLLGEPDSVANLFNSLLKNVTHGDFNSRYSDICKDLKAFYTSPLNNMRATLIHDYCSTPWQTAASIAGILLLILSMIQAVCSIIQVAQ